MDRIYSRNRIKIPKMKIINYDIKKLKRILKIIVILLIASITFHQISKSIVSIFEGLAVEKVKRIATEVMNEEVNKVLAGYNYKDLVTVTKGEENNTNILKTDVVIINKITSDLPLAIEERFKSIQNEKIRNPNRYTNWKQLSSRNRT